jgi:rhamnogalacturonyl hydrolase YesR
MESNNLFQNLIPVFFIVLIFSCSTAKRGQSNAGKKDDLTRIDENFKDGVAQYKVLMKSVPPEKFPRTYLADSNKLITSGSGWWCSGFYPGTLLYLYEATGDKEMLSEAERIMKPLAKEQYTTTTHDLGFMMYCSFGNAYRLNQKEEYKQILINSAKSLSTRFNPTVGAIRSWDWSKPEDFMVIIDNMMNLELLFWATKATGDSSFYKIAVSHANTTMKHHFREDYSSYHLITYNTSTGKVKEKKTVQGAGDETAWARGQGWALYGYTVMYRETKDKKYLDQAKNIANFIIKHPNLPKDKIPYWDFNAPDIPNTFRDASAAALIASALIELKQYVDKKDGKNYISISETILKNLSDKKYKASIGTNGGFILKHSVGHLPAKSEIDVPLTYADYYFIEALQRYKSLMKLSSKI